MFYAWLAQLGEHLPYSTNSHISFIMNSKEIGNLTELQCITALYALGCDVSIPFGNSQKYDLIMDYKGKLYKVQVKHANEVEGEYFTFKTRWQGHNTSGYTQTSYTKEDIDLFATYCQNQLYLIPVEECSGALKTIRFIPPKNGQIKGVNFAKDYVAEEVLKRL